MSKSRVLLVIGLAVIVAACGGPKATTPVAKPSPVIAAPPTAVKAAPPTPTQVAVAPTKVAVAPTSPGGLSITPAAVSAPPRLDPAGMCKATGSPQPVPGFATNTPSDRVRGPNQAPVTLYEYSDFQ